MNQPPLNPDAVDRVAKALMDDAGYTWGNATEKFRDGFRHHARIALAAALPEVTSVPGVYDLGSPEPAGVDQVVECDEHGHPYIRHWAEDEDYTWSKTTDGTRWKGYKDGKEYRTWADLVRRYGPLTEYRPDVTP